MFAVALTETPFISNDYYDKRYHHMFGHLSCLKSRLALTEPQMKDLLRRYPDMAEVCIGQISDLSLATISEPDAKAALIWMLGTFGQAVQVGLQEANWVRCDFNGL